LGLTRDLRILGPEPDIENDRIDAGFESSTNGICCGPRKGTLVRDLETMKPELETDDNNSETVSERSGDKVYH